MGNIILALPILLPIVGGSLFLVFPQKDGKQRVVLTEGIVLINSLLTMFLLITVMNKADSFTLFKLTGNLKVSFHIDGMGALFSGLIAFLWPLATLYALEYMKHDNRKNSFFACYIMTYGVTMGIAWAGNLVTLYLFYELLTLVTFPLVLHTMTKEAIVASRKYLYFSIGGASFAFIGLVFVLNYGITTDFVYGGVMDRLMQDTERNKLLVVYVLAFFGFGVKAAIFPVHGWLPAATVAPTPVTALLHAVAVVKSGAFAILRITYFCFGAEFLKGSWSQSLVLAAALITILFGSTMAVKEVHWKRRLAYSTISNLSYILLGAAMMSPLGLAAALSHMVFHGVMKICSFFCAGAVMHQSGKEYVYELNGMGRKMPVTFFCFTLASLSLIGIPPLAGFISKWNLAMAAFDSGTRFSYLAVGCLLYAAFMTAVYMLTVVVRAYIPNAYEDSDKPQGNRTEEFKDPGWKMLVPLVSFAAVILGLGLYSSPLMHFIQRISEGVAG